MQGGRDVQSKLLRSKHVLLYFGVDLSGYWRGKLMKRTLCAVDLANGFASSKPVPAVETHRRYERGEGIGSAGGLAGAFLGDK